MDKSVGVKVGIVAALVALGLAAFMSWPYRARRHANSDGLQPGSGPDAEPTFRVRVAESAAALLRDDPGPDGTTIRLVLSIGGREGAPALGVRRHHGGVPPGMVEARTREALFLLEKGVADLVPEWGDVIIESDSDSREGLSARFALAADAASPDGRADGNGACAADALPVGDYGADDEGDADPPLG